MSKRPFLSLALTLAVVPMLSRADDAAVDVATWSTGVTLRSLVPGAIGVERRLTTSLWLVFDGSFQRSSPPEMPTPGAAPFGPLLLASSTSAGAWLGLRSTLWTDGTLSGGVRIALRAAWRSDWYTSTLSTIVTSLGYSKSQTRLGVGAGAFAEARFGALGVRLGVSIAGADFVMNEWAGSGSDGMDLGVSLSPDATIRIYF